MARNLCAIAPSPKSPARLLPAGMSAGVDFVANPIDKRPPLP